MPRQNQDLNNIMKDKLVYRKYKKGDEHKIVELWQKIFADVPVEKLDVKCWQWLYRDNPLNDSRIWLAFDNQKLISQYTIVPFEFIFNGKKIKAGITVDFMTDKAYRGKFIFYNLAKLAHNESKDLCFVYAYPNEISYPIFKKTLGWHDVGITPLIVKPLNFSGFLMNNNIPSPLAKLADLPFRVFNLINKKNKFTVKRIEYFDDKVDRLLKKCFNPKIGQLKSKNYLNWRFTKHPKRKYDIFVIEDEKELLGYIVCRFSIQYNSLVGVIMDIAGLDKDVINGLISYSLGYLKEKKAHFAICMISRNNPYYRRFCINGFLKVPDFINPRKWNLIVKLKDDRHKELIFDSKNWFMTWANDDIL